MANRTHYAREWSLFMNEYPLIISNLMPTSFFYPDRDFEGKEGVTEVLGAALWSYSMNFIGHPAGIVPTHIANTTAGPVPIGIQIIGPQYGDLKTIGLAKLLEKEGFPEVGELLTFR